MIGFQKALFAISRWWDCNFALWNKQNVQQINLCEKSMVKSLVPLFIKVPSI